MSQYRRNPLVDLSAEQRSQLGKVAAFGLLGLILGLFFAWVIWPADVVNNSLDGLRADLRAEYLSSLADAYVATGGDNADIVLARLQELSNPAAEIEAAIAYYQRSNRETAPLHEFNLRALAAAFLANPALLSSNEPNPAPFPAENTPSLRWLNWLWIGLAVLVLIPGGIWIFYQFVMQRAHEEDARRDDLREDAVADDEDDMPEEEDDDTGTPSYGPRELSREEQMANWQSRQAQTAPPPPAAQTQAKKFGAEVRPPESAQQPPLLPPTDTEAENSRDLPISAFFEPEDTPIYHPPSRSPNLEDEEDDEWDDDDYDDDFESDLDEGDLDEGDAGIDNNADDEDDAYAASYHPPYRTQVEEEEVDSEDTEGEDTEGEDTEGEDTDEEESDDTLTDRADLLPPAESSAQRPKSGPILLPPALPSADRSVGEPDKPAKKADPPAQPDTRSQKPSSPSQPPSVKRNGEIGLFGQMQEHIAGFRRRDKAETPQSALVDATANYYHGIKDYDESFTVIAPDNPKDTLGACGIGTVSELDPASASSDSVRVLDIWLYDKASMRTQNQLLVARGVNLEGLAQRVASSGTVTGEPLVIDPNLTFKLRGGQLVLECTITAITYLSTASDAPFKSVSIAMKVTRK